MAAYYIPSLVAAGMVLLLILEGMIFGQFGAKAQEGADYVITLGASVKTGPSYMHRKRLDKAIEYLNANPETKVIVSGGQGYNEPVSEAEECKDIFETAGIDRADPRGGCFHEYDTESDLAESRPIGGQCGRCHQ